MKATALTTSSGTPVSNFSFGTMQFGGKADADQSRKMYDASRAAGINFFDTAYVYTEGRSEKLLGQFAKHERDDLVIATKCASVGVSPITLAVSWVAQHAGVTQPIISARSEEQLRPSIDAISFEMTDELYNRITALSVQPAPATDRLEEA